MQILTTPEEMRSFDAAAANRYRIPGSVLMENAGRGVADRIANATGNIAGKDVAIVCGKGNNGGDGFVVGRHLLLRGARVTVFLLATPAAIKGDARLHLDILLALRKPAGDALRIVSCATRFNPPPLAPAIIVDAIFGTGFSGAPRGVSASAIRWINATEAFVVAIDIPSGLDGATGHLAGDAVRADLTVTMAAEKVGQYLASGPDCCGRIEVVDIGITPAVMGFKNARVYRADDRSIAAILPQRAREANKYSAGKVLVLGGSRQYTGAPVLTALAALRSGAGAVTLGVPASVRSVVASRTRDVVILGLPETEAGTLSLVGLEQIRERIAWADAVVIGPGLGRNDVTDALLNEIFSTCTKPLLIDADALTAVAGRSAKQWRRPGPTVLTPHGGELSRLIGAPSTAIEWERLDSAVKSAKRFASVLVLKGASTVCARPDGIAAVNTTGNPGLATIGTGDVLAGTIGGLIAQGVDTFHAAVAGVYVHGRAGDIAAHRYGQRSLLASDLLDALPSAFLSLEHQ
jgi:ADP-dependent NAD(P)H-hydrate dehydratase / NAD(P)H-hydrate epimerase